MYSYPVADGLFQNSAVTPARKEIHKKLLMGLKKTAAYLDRNQGPDMTFYICFIVIVTSTSSSSK